MRWALVMMWLCAACRKTSVRRTTGTAPDEMTSASTWPGPTEGSWSMSPTIRRAALSGTAFISDCISMTSTIEVSSITNRSQSSGLSSPRLKPPPLGSTSSSRWIVLASKPVASVMRLAARPVGAHSRISVPFAARIRRMALTMVVLPTPGPPVITVTLDISARRTAATWLAAKARLMRFSTHGKAFVRIDPGPRQRAVCQTCQPIGNGAFRPMQTGQEYTRRHTDLVGNHGALLQLEIKRRTDQLLRHLEQLLGQRDQLFRRQTAVPLVHRLGQRIGNSGAHPDRRCLFDAELHCNGVCGLKANTANIARQPVWVFGHDLDGVRTIGLEDPHRPRRADTVAMQEDHNFPDCLLFGPGSENAGKTSHRFQTRASRANRAR